MSDEQKPAPTEGTVNVTAHRKLTWRVGDDFETVESYIVSSETRDHALKALKEWLQRLDQVLVEEKNAKIKTQAAKPPTTARTSTPLPPQQTPAAGDPYADLRWQQGKTRTGKTYGYRMVTTDQPARATELCKLLRESGKNQVFFGNVEYRLTVAKVDRLPKYPAGTQFLQRWTN
ncbi:MAG: hypothetical protein ABSG57_12190 [Candidatus Bathyarchaeia archaeon]|jgi:hypothetical protein